jgi:hypothetical protein
MYRSEVWNDVALNVHTLDRRKSEYLQDTQSASDVS